MNDQNFRRAMKAGIVLAALALGCGGQEQGADVPPEVVARVGDTQITAERLKRAVGVLYPPGNPRPADAPRQALQRIIDAELLVMAARERGLEHDIKVKQIVAERRQELLLEELYRRGILKFTSVVTADEVRDYFDRYKIGQQRRLRRILVADEAAVGEVMQRLEGGGDFAALAAELSDDGTTAKEGGDIGWHSRLHFKNHVLRRQVFNAAVGDIVGPFREPDGYTLLKVGDERQVDLASMAAEVQEVVRQQKQSLTTMRYLEDLADEAGVEDDAEALAVLLKRLSEAGEKLPQLRGDEPRRVLLRQGATAWTLSQFINAMYSERDKAEINSPEDLRLYARRLYALKRLLPRRAEELGLAETEHVSRNLEKARRDALVDRLRKVEVDELIDPSDDDMRQYYQRHKARYGRQDRVSILEILVADRAEAEDIRRQIDAGADIAELAERHSVRSARVRRAGGRIQLMSPDKYGRIGQEAYNARVGDIVGPIKSSQGYSVFKVLKREPGVEFSYDQSKYRVRSHLRQDLIAQGFQALLKRLNERYADRVEVFEENLARAGGKDS